MTLTQTHSAGDATKMADLSLSPKLPASGSGFVQQAHLWKVFSAAGRCLGYSMFYRIQCLVICLRYGSFGKKLQGTEYQLLNMRSYFVLKD